MTKKEFEKEHRSDCTFSVHTHVGDGSISNHTHVTDVLINKPIHKHELSYEEQCIEHISMAWELGLDPLAGFPVPEGWAPEEAEESASQ